MRVALRFWDKSIIERHIAYGLKDALECGGSFGYDVDESKIESL